jgi:hypothetical protein
VSDLLRATEIESYPESRVHNSQPHGIGRVAALDGLGAWSNLGRNVVLTGPDLRPRAVFDESVFTEDEPSQYDLDVHAVLDVAEQGLVVTINHYGMVRAFDRDEVAVPGPVRRVRPRWTRDAADDVERWVIVDGRLVGSGPREQRTGGLLVSGPLLRDGDDIPLTLTRALEGWGMVSALAPLDAGHVVIGGDARVGVAAIDDRGAVELRWDVAVDFEPAMVLADGARIWAAGSDVDPTVDDYDWEARLGGGFAALDPVEGRVVVHGRFDDGVAWGTGGVAVVVADELVIAVGRRGEVQCFDGRVRAWVRTTAAVADTSLGIAHAAVIGDHLVYGFNRGAYRLWTLPLPALRRTP